MDIIWKAVLAVVMSVGGIGAVFVAVIHFSSNIIAERLQKKYDLKLNEEFEKYKVGLDNKKLISKTIFETEFSIYRELTKAYFTMIKDVNMLIPTGVQITPLDKAERDKFELDNYQRTKKSALVAQDMLNGNSPFIPERIFKEYDVIMKLCSLQLTSCELRWESMNWTSCGEKEDFPEDAYERTKEINDRFGKLNDLIRNYLDSLVVLD